LRAETREPHERELLIACTHMRTASPSIHPCLRQAVLRASFWLATWLTTRPCDLPADKTLDASNRRLPLKRTACTRTSCVPGPLSRLSPRGHPTESLAPCGSTGGRGVSHHPHPLRRIAPNTTGCRFVFGSGLASFVSPRGERVCCERGRCLPTVLGVFDRASDTPVASSSSAET
jgi:hypothetical protein